MVTAGVHHCSQAERLSDAEGLQEALEHFLGHVQHTRVNKVMVVFGVRLARHTLSTFPLCGIQIGMAVAHLCTVLVCFGIATLDAVEEQLIASAEAQKSVFTTQFFPVLPAPVLNFIRTEMTADLRQILAARAAGYISLPGSLAKADLQKAEAALRVYLPHITSGISSFAEDQARFLPS